MVSRVLVHFVLLALLLLVSGCGAVLNRTPPVVVGVAPLASGSLVVERCQYEQRIGAPDPWYRVNCHRETVPVGALKPTAPPSDLTNPYSLVPVPPDMENPYRKHAGGSR